MKQLEGSPQSHSEEFLLQWILDVNSRHEGPAPTMEIQFESLSVEAEVDVGKRKPPTLYNAAIHGSREAIGLLKLFPQQKKRIKILDNLKGVIKPSRMTLVLGPPASGKSTFLQALSGKLDSSLKIHGRLTYNGEELENSMRKRRCAYVPQDDVHHPELTVRETLEFSRQMLEAVGTSDMMNAKRKREEFQGSVVQKEIGNSVKVNSKAAAAEDFVTESVIKILGLQECADTIIGNEMRRGISGGQKKRVTIGEMLVGLARSYFMDNISTGLDSATTSQIVKFLSKLTHSLHLTMVISLLQPMQETFELFDDIILLCEGRMVYHGPREYVLTFFEYMGFRCPKGKNIADFLQEVTSEMDQEQYWVGHHSVYEYVSVQQFADSYFCFRVQYLLEDDLLKPYDSLGRIQNDKFERRCDISKRDVFKTCFSREILLLKRNSAFHIVKAIQLALLAFVTMTIFFRTRMKHHSVADGDRFMGAIFISVVIVMFNGLSELSMMTRRLPIYYKQRKLLLLPEWAFLSPICVLSLPISVLETGIWTCLTYYVIGFSPSPSRFLLHLLALFCVHQTSVSLFHFIAVVGRTEIISTTFAIVTLVAIYILGGFVISKDDIKTWLTWGPWLSPMTYGQNAVAINQFLDDRWNMGIETGQGNLNTVGKLILRSRGMFTEWHWFWICIGALIALALLFNILCVFALTWLRAPHGRQHDQNLGTVNPKKAAVRSTQPKEASCQGKVLPFEPLNLTFSHISYSVDMPREMSKARAGKKTLQLLQDVSGAFKPGVLTSLMGVTGAGKTTLLDVLAGRKTGGYIEGRINLSGYPKKQEAFARIFGYCEQNDIHSPFLTVHESLQFSAWLRLPSHVDMHARQLLADEIMDLVELGPWRNALVGVPGRNGLSAEQLKRLTIAVEMVSSPSILFMDEPTTGLDARSAAVVMRTVRRTVDNGRTVVCTIHQPTLEIFESFDEYKLDIYNFSELHFMRDHLASAMAKLSPRNVILAVIADERRWAAHIRWAIGSFISSNDSVFRSKAIPGVPKFRDGQNPAAWMLDVTSVTTECQLGIDYAAIFRQASVYLKNMETVEELSKVQDDIKQLHFPTKYATSFRSQCVACYWKQHRSYWKNPELNILRFINTIVITFLFGVVFMGIGSKITTEQDIFNILGAMYVSALFLGFSNANLVQPVVDMERVVFYRERSAGMYSFIPYAIAQVSVEIPYIVVQVIIFSLIVYPMLGLDSSLAKVLWFLVFMALNMVYFTVFGMMAIALTPAKEIAGALSYLFFILWNIFSGFFIPRKMIPVWWRWFYWTDPAAWTLYGLMASQLSDHTNLIHVPGAPDLMVKDFLQNYFGIHHNHLAVMVVLHFGIVMVFLLVYGFGIKYLNFQKR